jgi:hypothetical protein
MRLPIRVALVAVIVPIALTAVGVALQLAWLPDVPAQIATHWNFAGDADATGPAWSMPLALGIAGIAVPVVFGLILARTIGRAGPTAMQKVLAAASLFAVTLMSIAFTGSIGIQRGVTGSSGAESVLPILIGGYAVAIVAAVAGWFVMPRSVPGSSTRMQKPPVVSLRDGERVAWVSYARFDTGILIAFAATLALVIGLAVFVVATTGAWVIVAVPVIVAVALLGSGRWQVRVDEGGLTVRAALGWPRYRVTLADVASAGVTDVVALGEFGGYGVRYGLGRRLGVITRSGEALEVKRRDGRAIIVTVDDAATAAGLLTALAARAGTV